MSILPILKYPDPALNVVCKDVLYDADTEQLATDLYLTMLAYAGAGLAAPQVGRPVRMFCMRYKGRGLIMCNPEIVRRGKEMVRAVESCLSIPGKSIMVDRNQIITIMWYTIHGEQHTLKIRGNDARCAQHEMDHLEGKLII